MKRSSVFSISEGYENKPPLQLWTTGLLGEARAGLSAWRSLPEQRFVIFAQGRTGSTLLTNSLDSHPDIRCDDEILRRPRLAPLRFLENRARGAGAVAFGFHVKCYQLWRFQRVEDLGAWLRRLDERGWKIVYLWRENPVEHVISGMFARSNQRYHYQRDKTEARVEQIDVVPERLIRKIEKRLRLLETERQALEGLDHFELRYGRDLLDPAARTAALARLQTFIGVKPADLRSDLVKSVNRPLPQLIINYDEVARALAATPFARYLPAEAA